MNVTKYYERMSAWVGPVTLELCKNISNVLFDRQVVKESFVKVALLVLCHLLFQSGFSVWLKIYSLFIIRFLTSLSRLPELAAVELEVELLPELLDSTEVEAVEPVRVEIWVWTAERALSTLEIADVMEVTWVDMVDCWAVVQVMEEEPEISLARVAIFVDWGNSEA